MLYTRYLVTGIATPSVASMASFTEVHHNARAAALRRLDALLDGVREVRAARADVGTEDIGTITLVVEARTVKLDIFIF